MSTTAAASPPAPHFAAELHTRYIQALNTQTHRLDFWMSEHLRLNGVYWGLTALALMRRGDALDRDELLKYVLSCQHANGAFGGHVGHDPHLLFTLSAVQILATLDALHLVDGDRIAAYVKSLQQADGSFSGDEYNEIDTRFSYCAVSCLSLLNRLHAPHAYIDVEKAVKYIDSCKNFDGGYGSVAGAESHSGQIFCCVGALAILGRMDLVDADRLGWWLAERQLKTGGLNGRPEKLPDVCYSWWVLSSLSMMQRMHWINRDKLIAFILSAQDLETGGIADRAGDVSDVFHTLFGVAGLSLLGYPGLDPVDPRYCMPASVIERLGIK
ncbi:hypothetical protein HDU83_004342 [Entophlyctis luteolus]|nr:hypothetical protein HDU82_004996 [Entophlyctis luteolus]KAJ3354934.1 hypothetical protein HDU83_004342 [Entophlyctis luteolus]KAJ3394751.1 hypothetical protein HDU84_006894 [Entophlyctis sp. JEL0112]